VPLILVHILNIVFFIIKILQHPYFYIFYLYFSYLQCQKLIHLLEYH